MAIRKKRAQPERAIEKAIMAYLAIHKDRVEVFKNQNKGVYHQAVGRWMLPPAWHNSQGTADVVGTIQCQICKRGLSLHLEVKSPTGKLSPTQKERLARVRELGGIAAIVRSVEEVEKIVKGSFCCPL